MHLDSDCPIIKEATKLAAQRKSSTTAMPTADYDVQQTLHKFYDVSNYMVYADDYTDNYFNQIETELLANVKQPFQWLVLLLDKQSPVQIFGYSEFISNIRRGKHELCLSGVLTGNSLRSITIGNFQDLDSVHYNELAGVNILSQALLEDWCKLTYD
jgi:hypothetical protein